MADVREMRIFSAEQIVVHPELPAVLKNYSKEIIRKNPDNVVQFSRLYFEQLLKDQGYFDDNLEKLQITGKSLLFRQGEKVLDNYTIGEMYTDSQFRKARVGIHKKTGLERAILQKDKKEYPNRDAFIQKMEKFATYDHPNIVRYLEIYEDEKFFYIVCECLKGDDVAQNIWLRGGYNEGYAAEIIQQILVAVQYIHSKGVAHNQLYPVNILHVNPNSPQIKLIDLDEAGTSPVKDMHKYMRGGDYKGCFVAPEIIKGDWNIKNDEYSVGVIMYYMLMGNVPFYGWDYKETFQLILDFKYDNQSYYYQQISEEGRDLLTKLMALKPEDRLTATEALKHPWFKKAQKGEYNKKDLGEALQNMKKFHAGGKLKQAVVGFFTQNLLSQQELTDLAEQFKQFDTNGNGSLSRDELIEGFRQTRGVNWNEKDVDDLIKVIDADGSGDVNYSEFVQTALSKEKLFSEERLEKAFKVFDKDGDSQISVQEIRELLDACKQVDEKMVQRAIKDIDKIGKGKLSFQEFKGLIKRLFE